MPKARSCKPPSGSPKTTTPTTAAEIGNITVKTPARDAGTFLSPLIHSHTVHTLAANA